MGGGGVGGAAAPRILLLMLGGRHRCSAAPHCCPLRPPARRPLPFTPPYCNPSALPPSSRPCAAPVDQSIARSIAQCINQLTIPALQQPAQRARAKAAGQPWGLARRRAVGGHRRWVAGLCGGYRCCLRCGMRRHRTAGGRAWRRAVGSHCRLVMARAAADRGGAQCC